MTPELIIIGASAGGLQAVDRLVGDLPLDYPVPIVVVLHLLQNQSTDYLSYFHKVRMPVVEATEKIKPQAGRIYIAPPGYHLLLESDGTFSLSVEERVSWARPSIDVFFETAAEAIGNRLVAIILTGANDDGAAGMKAVASLGGACIVQDPATADSNYMPRAALSAAPEARVADLKGIAGLLSHIGRSHNV